MRAENNNFKRRYKELKRKYTENERSEGIRTLYPKVRDNIATAEEKKLYAELAELGSLRLYFEEPGIKEMLETVWSGDRAIQEIEQHIMPLDTEQKRELMIPFIRMGFEASRMAKNKARSDEEI